MLGLIKAGMMEGFLKCSGQVRLQGYLSSISSIGFMSLWKAPGKEKENPTSIRVRAICYKLCNSKVEVKNPRKQRENPLSSSLWGPLFYPQDGVQGGLSSSAHWMVAVHMFLFDLHIWDHCYQQSVWAGWVGYSTHEHRQYLVWHTWVSAVSAGHSLHSLVQINKGFFFVSEKTCHCF